MLLREVFFSRLVGRRVMTVSGRQLGVVRDIVAESAGELPTVVGLRIDREGYLPIASLIGGVSARELTVSKVTKDVLRGGQWCAAERLLDRQVIDRQGKRVRRVNDLVLAVCGKDDTEEKVFLVGADVGIRGVCRRLGAEWLTAWCEKRLLGYRRLAMVEDAERLPDLRFEWFESVAARDVIEICRKLSRCEARRFLEQLAGSLVMRGGIRAEAIESASIVAELPKALQRIVCDEIKRQMRCAQGGASCKET